MSMSHKTIQDVNVTQMPVSYKTIQYINVRQTDGPMTTEGRRTDGSTTMDESTGREDELTE